MCGGEGQYLGEWSEPQRLCTGDVLKTTTKTTIPAPSETTANLIIYDHNTLKLIMMMLMLMMEMRMKSATLKTLRCDLSTRDITVPVISTITVCHTDKKRIRCDGGDGGGGDCAE